jgi:hypothetical protein
MTVDEAQAEIARLKNLLDRDHTGLASALNDCRQAVRSWGWIPAGEWGCYEYPERTEENLRKEVGQAFDQIEQTALTALRESGMRAGAAFVPERDQLAVAIAIVERLLAVVDSVQGYEFTISDDTDPATESARDAVARFKAGDSTSPQDALRGQLTQAVGERDELLAKARTLLACFSEGLRAVTRHGVASFPFQAQTDQTTAALKDLKETVARLTTSTNPEGAP